jgi:ribokinase
MRLFAKGEIDMRILNFGSLNIDYVYQVDHVVKPGETISSYKMQVFPGGKGLNQSIALARAGAEVWHAGCIGANDGAFLVELLRENGVDVRNIYETGDPTGNAIIQVDRNGQNSIIVYSGANGALQKEHIDAVLGEASPDDVLLVQNEVSNISYLIKKGLSLGLSIAFNPSPFEPYILKLPLERLSYLFVNMIEAAEITGSTEDDPEKLMDALEKRFPKTAVILTRGNQGAEFLFEGKRIHQDIFPIDVVDTTAAGDTFTGFFLGAIANGKDVSDALRIASKASSIAVSRMGASMSIPYLNECSAE